MRKNIFIGLLFILLTASAAAFSGEIIFVDGVVSLIRSDTSRHEADFGDLLSEGDTIITTDTGTAEIKTAYSTIQLAPDTVFTFREVEVGNSKRDVLSCITGAVLFKIDKIRANPPVINTISTNAGIRGTEFTIFAAPDGSCLFSVTEGLVAISTPEGSVELAAAEGIEIIPGQAMAKKFKVLRGQLDFRQWHAQRILHFLENPVITVYNLYARVQDFANSLAQIKAQYDLNKELLDITRKTLQNKEKQEGKESAQFFYTENVLPLEVETSYQKLNIRYYALSALSLRRYLLSRLYLLMKIEYLGREDDQTYRDYLYAHEQVLDLYETGIVPYLVIADI